VKSKVGDTVESAKEGAKKTFEQAKDKAEDIWNKSPVDQAKEKVADTWESVKDTTKNTFE